MVWVLLKACIAGSSRASSLGSLIRKHPVQSVVQGLLLCVRIRRWRALWHGDTSEVCQRTNVWLISIFGIRIIVSEPVELVINRRFLVTGRHFPSQDRNTSNISVIRAGSSRSSMLGLFFRTESIASFKASFFFFGLACRLVMVNPQDWPRIGWSARPNPRLVDRSYEATPSYHLLPHFTISRHAGQGHTRSIGRSSNVDTSRSPSRGSLFRNQSRASSRAFFFVSADGGPFGIGIPARFANERMVSRLNRRPLGR
jgi:hypothetical protein